MKGFNRNNELKFLKQSKQKNLHSLFEKTA